MSGVPNSDESFGTNVIEGKILVSKRVNNDGYSAGMATKADSQGYIKSIIAAAKLAK